MEKWKCHSHHLPITLDTYGEAAGGGNEMDDSATCVREITLISSNASALCMTLLLLPLAVVKSAKSESQGRRERQGIGGNLIRFARHDIPDIR